MLRLNESNDRPIAVSAGIVSTVRRKKVVAAINETAEMLGNAPAVCRGSYICPEIINSFGRGKIIDNYFDTLEDFLSYRGRKLHPAEDSLLKLLKRSAEN